MSDHNECPTCTQDWVANTDYECGCCGRPASEHIRVTSLCRILRETQQREHKERALADRLAEAATAVIDQWDTPNWKLTESTATCMNTLRNALVACKESRQDRNHS